MKKRTIRVGKALGLLLLAAVGFMIGWAAGVSLRDDERIEKELAKVSLEEPVQLEQVAKGDTGKAEVTAIEAYLQKFQGYGQEIKEVQEQLNEWEKDGGTPDMSELLQLRLTNQRAYMELDQMASMPEKELRELTKEQGEDYEVWIEDWVQMLTTAAPVREWEKTLRGIYEENLARIEGYGDLGLRR